MAWFVKPTRGQLEALRYAYPAGSRVELTEMGDKFTNLKPGDRGTVQGIDEAARVLMRWDNGSTLSLIPGEDKFWRVD